MVNEVVEYPPIASAPASENFTPNHWLVKFAPFRTSWSEIVKRGLFTLRGVRSPLACSNLAAMRCGDLVLFYHSQEERAVVGLMEVTREAYPDLTSADSKWLTCDFRPIRTLPRPVSLLEIKAQSALANLPLVRQPRLAVMPLPASAFQQILHLADNVSGRNPCAFPPFGSGLEFPAFFATEVNLQPTGTRA